MVGTTGTHQYGCQDWWQIARNLWLCASTLTTHFLWLFIDSSSFHSFLNSLTTINFYWTTGCNSLTWFFHSIAIGSTTNAGTKVWYMGRLNNLINYNFIGLCPEIQGCNRLLHNRIAWLTKSGSLPKVSVQLSLCNNHSWYALAYFHSKMSFKISLKGYSSLKRYK